MADTFAPATLPHATTARLFQHAHRSIARAPLLSLDPRQVVPIPLHITMGVTTRLLRLAVELIISCRGRAVGLLYAYELAETLRTSVRVSPGPYHGGVFIEGGVMTKKALLSRPCRLYLMCPSSLPFELQSGTHLFAARRHPPRVHENRIRHLCFQSLFPCSSLSRLNDHPLRCYLGPGSRVLQALAKNDSKILQ